jgi:hypothetical protein
MNDPPATNLPSSPEALSYQVDTIRRLIEFLFSGLVLAYVAIIVSGKLLASAFPGRRLPGQSLRLPLFIMNFQAENDEVIFGMTSFILTLLLTAFLGGPDFYFLFVKRFGLDAGQFNTLCIASAFFSVIWSASLYVLTARLSRPADAYGAEHEEMLKKIQQKQHRTAE